MLIINSITIDEFSTRINVDVTGTLVNGMVSPQVYSQITQVLLWTSETFKDYTKAIDVTSFVTAPVNGNYSFSIPAEDIELPNMNGIFFLEFTTDTTLPPENCIEDSNIALGIAANLIKYHECLLNKVMKMDIKGCKKVESQCEECEEDLLYLSVLIEAIYTTVKFGFYEEAVKIMGALDDICDICHSCPDYKNTRLINGYGFGTVNNAIILI